MGDFHIHHPEWGYSVSDEDGEALAEWTSNSDLALTHDAKQHGPFYSARWQKDYSPVLGDFPHSQHRQLLNHIGLQLPIIHGSSEKRWNFRKADWDLNSNKLERSVVNIPSCCIPIKEAYQRFKGAIFSAATTAIPRGCKPVYSQGGRTFSYLAPKLWNSLPENVRGSDTLSLFKSRLKTHLFSQAFI